MKLLIVDDDSMVRRELVICLRLHGFVMDEADNGERAVALAHINEYDLIILDLTLPDMEGGEVCERLRRSKRNAPILVLSVVADPSSKARLLNTGADDYLSKPFSCEELVARVRALLRRRQGTPHDVVKVSDIEMDILRQHVRRRRRSIPLTAKEFSLLEYLMLHAGTVVRKATLIEHVWDSASNPFSGAIDTHMHHLRRKLGSPEVIHTVYRRGYRIDT